MIVRTLLLPRHLFWHSGAAGSVIRLMTQIKFWHQDRGDLGKDVETFKIKMTHI